MGNLNRHIALGEIEFAIEKFSHVTENSTKYLRKN